MIHRRPGVYSWEISDSEIDGYLAVKLYFGLVKVARKEDYW